LGKMEQKRFTNLLPKSLFHGGAAKPKERSRLTKYTDIFQSVYEAHFQVDHALARVCKLPNFLSKKGFTVDSLSTMLLLVSRCSFSFFLATVVVTCSPHVHFISNGRETGKKTKERKNEEVKREYDLKRGIAAAPAAGSIKYCCGVTARGEASDGAITFVTENFQYHRPQLLTDRKLRRMVI
ncbi:hypothetical protein ALC60_00869, partial [Trachymyrmex zeteki]